MKEYFFKPGVLYLTLLSFAVNLGFTFQLTYLSSVFKFFGAESSQLSFLWLAPPITGLIVQPLIGQISDAAIKRGNKRSPYIIGSGILAVLSLLLIPYAGTLLRVTVLVWILNASVNGCMAVWRALIVDLSPQEEWGKAFAFQGFWGGLGSASGVALPYLIDRIHSFADIYLGGSKLSVGLHGSFIIAGVVLAAMLVIFALKVKEPTNKNVHQDQENFFKFVIKPFIDVVHNLKKSSVQFKNFCVWNSVSWFGIFIFWIYFILVLAQNFYSLPAGTSDENMALQYIPLFQKATSDSSGYLSISQFMGIFYSLFLFFLLEHTNKVKLIHGISLAIGSVGMFLIGLAHTPVVLFISMLGVGILLGSCAVLPYVLVSQIIPEEKIGVYFGLFNIGITFSQIIGALTLSPIYLHLLGGHAAYILFFAGVVILISAVLWLRPGLREPV